MGLIDATTFISAFTEEKKVKKESMNSIIGNFLDLSYFKRIIVSL